MRIIGLVIVFGLVAVARSQAPFSFPVSRSSILLLVRSKINVPSGRVSALSDVRIVHYWKSRNHFTEYRLKNITRLLSSKNFNNQLPTVLYAHGYVEERDDESVQTIVKAYLKHGGYNLLVLDWANLGYGNYLVAAANSVTVGRETGRALVKLVRSGLRLEGLHLVGHSLGAHVSGYAARALAAKGMLVPRLTGLDPAMPGFYPPLDISGKPMTASDAQFVDAIHTDGGRYGTPLVTAQADFWPNGGLSHQPGCTHLLPFTVEEFCSHWRSWRFFAESVAGGQFLARPCTDYNDFLRGSCSDRDMVPMGINADSSAKGNFYLRTASVAPYALGERGAT